MKRNLIQAVALIAAGILSLGTAQAQSAQKQQTFESFSSISVSGDFQVTLTPGSEYGATLSVDQACMPYVQCFVSSGTLIVTVGKLPKEVKKLYKGKNKPSYYVVITAPKLGGVSLSDNATLMGTGNFTADQFKLDLAGRSQVRHLTVEDAAAADVTMAKNTIAELNLDADRISVSTNGSSSLRLQFSAENLALQAHGSSTLSATGDTGTTALTADGSSKVSLSGNSEEGIAFSTSGSTSVDALACKTPKADVVMTGGTVVEAATEALKLELSGRSSLIFDHDPSIEIVSVKTSSINHYGASTR